MSSKNQQRFDPHIRPMRAEDLGRVLEIEALCFSSPWTWNHFKKELIKACGRLRVAVSQQQIAGYLIAWLIDNELHIANLAVHPEFRGRGIGALLVRDLLNDVSGCELATLEVREGNIPARKLYEKLGFSVVGIRTKYYETEGEDALIMTKYLDQRYNASIP